MKILITGSGGFSGSNFCRQAKEDGHRVLGTDLNNWFVPKGCQIEKLDIRDQHAVFKICRTFRPDAIIHTARAPGSLGQLERDRATAYQINVLGTRNLAQCAEELEATLVFLSTDWIFDGTKPIGSKYDEEDEACPLNYYGVTKWIAEQEVRRVTTNWLIIRTAHIYGFHAAMMEPSYNTEMGVLEKTTWANIWNSLQKGEEVRLADTMYQTPVLVNHLVKTTLCLLNKGMTGIFNMVDRNCNSRYQIARTVLESLGLDSNLVIKGDTMDFAKSQDIPPELLGILPINTCLSVNRIEEALGTQMLTFEEGVAKMKACLNGLRAGASYHGRGE